MSHPRRRASAAIIGALLVLGVALPVMAHAEGATIQLSHDQIQPGATVTVHGQGMNPDEEVFFELGDATKALPLGTAVATGDGFVDAFLEIPWQTPKGPWEIYARGVDGDVVSAPIVLAGVALAPEEEQWEPADEEDPLVGLEPTEDPGGSPAASGGAGPTATSATVAGPAATFRPRSLAPQPVEAPTVRPSDPPPQDPSLWLIAASGGIAVVTLLVLALLLRRRSRPA